MKLKNYTETAVEHTLKEVLATKNDICKCEQCQLDIAAIALNNLPPLYYVHDKGEVFTKLTSTYNDFKVKVLTEVTKAVMAVSVNPRHRP